MDIIVGKSPPQAAPASPGVGGNNLTYVTEVKATGAVARDGRIGVGDILVAVKNSGTPEQARPTEPAHGLALIWTLCMNLRDLVWPTWP